MTALVKSSDMGAAIEQVLIAGNLADLKPGERVTYYRRVCESLGLNPLTKPFEYLTLNGKLLLYARKDATEQLRRIHGVSIHIVARELVEDVYVVTARAVDKTGRSDESIGAVTVGGLKGEARANALMKAETKAKRRVTLSIAGLGMLDELEVDTIPGAQRVEVDTGPKAPAGAALTAASTSSPAATTAPSAAPMETDDDEDEPAIDYVPTFRWQKAGGKGTLATGEWLPTGEAPKASNRQLARVHILLKEMGIDDAGYRKALAQYYGKSTAAELSRDEAGDLIDRLETKKRVGAAKVERQNRRFEESKAEMAEVLKADMRAQQAEVESAFGVSLDDGGAA